MSELKPRITENGIDYILVGDYYIPDLKLPEEHRPIGKYGRMHREYLREAHPARLNTLTLTGELWTYLADLNEQAQERLDTIIEEQKKAIRAGYDIDIIPSDLATYGRDAKALLKELQSQNERMFLVTFLVLNTGRTEQELENNVFQASSIAQKHNCNLCRLDFQQEQGLMSSLPLADCQIEIQRGLTTSSTAIFVPFTTQELFDNGKESLYYGLNALSNNLIMVDRKKLKNPNGLILGTPGSGKSFSAKREITNAFLVTDDDIIICDPEAEVRHEVA